MSSRARDVLAGLGAVAAFGIFIRAAAVAWQRVNLALGPVKVLKYKGRWALVTGGSEGIGKAIAASLASYGLNIILVSRSKAKLDAAQQELQTNYPGVQVLTISADLSQPEGRKQVLQQVAGQDIAVLIANAGGAVRSEAAAPYWEYRESDELSTYNLNGPSCYSLVRGLLPVMMQRGAGGAIVGISSLMSKWQAMAVPYGAEKAKMNAFMEGLDAELKLTGHDNITAQAMIVGGVLTPGTAKLVNPGLKHASPAEVAAVMAAEAAKGRQGLFGAPAPSVGESIVRAIGKAGPLVTPFWRHTLVHLLLDMWWPPALQRAVKRALTRQFLDKMRQQTATAQASKS